MKSICTDLVALIIVGTMACFGSKEWKSRWQQAFVSNLAPNAIILLIFWHGLLHNGKVFHFWILIFNKKERKKILLHICVLNLTFWMANYCLFDPCTCGFARNNIQNAIYLFYLLFFYVVFESKIIIIIVRIIFWTMLFIL